jgi:hypothetical protein
MNIEKEIYNVFEYVENQTLFVVEIPPKSLPICWIADYYEDFCRMVEEKQSKKEYLYPEGTVIWEQTCVSDLRRRTGKKVYPALEGNTCLYRADFVPVDRDEYKYTDMGIDRYDATVAFLKIVRPSLWIFDGLKEAIDALNDDKIAPSVRDVLHKKINERLKEKILEHARLKNKKRENAYMHKKQAQEFDNEADTYERREAALALLQQRIAKG